MIFAELTEKEFSDFTKKSSIKIFLQTVEESHINENKTIYLGVKENDKVIAGGLFIIKYNNKYKKNYYYAPKGPIFDFDNEELLKFYVNNLKKYVKKNNGYMIRFDPYITLVSRDKNGDKTSSIDNTSLLNLFKKLGFIYKNKSDQKKWMFVLPTKNKTCDEIWNDFKGNVKNIIRKCEKNNITIEEITKDYNEFKRIIDETGERKQFQVRDLEYYEKMKKEFKENVKFYIAKININTYINNLERELVFEEQKLKQLKIDSKRKNCEENIETIKGYIKEGNKILKEDGSIINLAASMFNFYGNEIVYMFSGSIEKYAFLNAPYLMQWYIIKKAIELNYDNYNFYGIEDLSDPNIKNHGIYDFKKGFNGYVLETIGELDLYLSFKAKIINFIKKISK